jgi:hypothetical protein
VSRDGHTRRQVVRAGIGGAALAIWMAADAGGVAPAAAAAPALGHGKIVLDWQPWRVGWGPGWDGIFYDATAPFRAQHPGVDIRVDVSTGPSSNDGAVVSAILAGAGPDVYSGFGPTKMIEGGYNLDLAPFLREYNVDTSQFDAGQYAKYVTNNGVFALPAELSTSAVAVNLTALDQMGLSYPAAQWDYQAAEKLWRSVARPSSVPNKSVVGFAFWGQKASWLAGDFYLRGWGASAAAGNYSSKSGLDTPEALRFANWWFPLAQDGVISWLGVAPPWPQQVVCGFAGSWMLPQFATQYRGLKWDFWPQPIWPTGTSAYAGNDYYAVSVTTRYPQLAAEFAIWLTTSRAWQESMMRLQLVLPPTKSFWPEWAQFVGTVAPPLAVKNLGAFTTAALQGRAFNHPAFAYNSDGAYSTIGNYMPLIVARKLSPEEGMLQAAKAVNAFEEASKAMAVAADKTAALLRQTSSRSGVVTYPAPTRSGFGSPATAPPAGYIRSANGTWTLVGDGSDVWTDSDNCTFAGIPWQRSDGDFTCRVVSIANIDCPHLSQWAKIGLMARGDLSNDAPMVLICASGANGVFTDVRTVAGVTPAQQGPVSPPPQTGLIAAKFLTKPNTQKHANYLLKPVWLRLSRQGAKWQPYSSFDGKTWTAAGTTVEAEMAGCWVGIFCLSHNGSFGGKGRIVANFDHLSFTPSVEVQLGSPGAP